MTSFKRQSRDLGFWETACEVAHNHFNGTGMIITIGHVNGPMKFDRLTQTLLQLSYKNPLLRAKLKSDNRDKSTFMIDESVTIKDIPVSIKKIQKSEWKDCVDEQLSLPFTAEENYVWRVIVFQVNENDNYICVVMHHSISDGLSGVQVIHEILDGQNPVHTHNDNISRPLYDPVERLRSTKISWFKFLANQVEINFKSFRIKKLKYESSADTENRATRQIYFRLERDYLDKLIDKCKSENVTITAALQGALILATASLNNNCGPVQCGVAVDLRAECEPPIPSEHIGCYIGVIATFHAVPKDVEFWELVRKCKKQLHSSKLKYSYNPVNFSKKFLEKTISSMLNKANKRREFIHNCAISNLGVIDIPDKNMELTLEELYFSTARHAGDIGLCANILSLNGVLHACISYEEPLVSTDSANKVLDNMLSIIKNAVGV